MTNHVSHRMMDRRSLLALAAMEGILAGAAGCSRADSAIVAAPMEATSSSANAAAPLPTPIRTVVVPPMRTEKPPPRRVVDHDDDVDDPRLKSSCASKASCGACGAGTCSGRTCCAGKNECKGKSGCKTALNPKGAAKNDCKGKGTSCPKSP